MSLRHCFLSGLLLIVSTGLAPVSAQQPERPTNLEWWHPLAAGAGVAAVFLVDEPVRDFLQGHRRDNLDEVADVTARFKDQEVFVITGGGALLLGAIIDEPKVAVTGAHIITAYGLSSLMMIGTKWAFGRARPVTGDATRFDWFNGDDDSAFPSGSAAVVFSLATSVADAMDRLPVSVVLYAGATVNAWARLNGDRHWLSDVTLGALYGITAAKLVNGEWTVFGLELPGIWTDGRSAGLQYRWGF